MTRYLTMFVALVVAFMAAAGDGGAAEARPGSVEALFQPAGGHTAQACNVRCGTEYVRCRDHCETWRPLRAGSPNLSQYIACQARCDDALANCNCPE